MSFFRQLTTSIYRFRDYPKLMLLSAEKTILYLVIIQFIVLIFFHIPVAIGYRQLGGITGAIQKNVPEFSITNGKLSCESIDFSDDMMGVKIYIDNNENAESIDTSGYSYFLIADSSKAIFGNNLQKSVIEFSQIFGDRSFSKQMLINIFTSRRVKLALAIIYAVTTLVMMCIRTLFSILSLALVVLCINSLFTHANISLTDAMKLSVYARTFPVLLTLLFGITGMSSFIVFWALQITYAYLGLKNIKNQESIILAEL